MFYFENYAEEKNIFIYLLFLSKGWGKKYRTHTISNSLLEGPSKKSQLLMNFRMSLLKPSI